MEIPWERLGIPKQHREVLSTDAPVRARTAAAKGLLPVSPAVQLSMFYVLLNDPDPTVVSAAQRSFLEMPSATVIGALGQRTHPKILEYLAEHRVDDQPLMERVIEVRLCNDRTVLRIAEHAGPGLCEVLSRNQERLLLTPEVYLVLKANPSCASAWVEKMEGFLRMQRALPQERVAPKPAATPAPTPQAAPSTPDLAAAALAEVEAALAGQVSPSTFVAPQPAEEIALFDLDFLDEGSGAAGEEISPVMAGFKLDFADEAESFSWNLLQEAEGHADPEVAEHQSIENIIGAMAVGKKIKLAYLGNGSARRVLIRDRNKMVASAVVKSGRMNEREVENAAGNRNLDSEVIRELTRNRDYMRKYTVKKALANNPKTPVPVATALLKFMHFKDLKELSANKNISSVIQTQAKRMVILKNKR